MPGYGVKLNVKREMTCFWISLIIKCEQWRVVAEEPSLLYHPVPGQNDIMVIGFLKIICKNQCNLWLLFVKIHEEELIRY